MTLPLGACCAAFLALMAGFGLRAAEAEPAWPLWDGRQSVEEYAQLVGLPPAKSLDLGGGVTMDFVLIPAGRFVMGTPEPVLPSESPLPGRLIFKFFLCAFLCLVGMILSHAWRTKTRPQFGLKTLLLLAVLAGFAMYGFARGKTAELDAVRYELDLKRWRLAEPNEVPAHLVTISRPYYLAKYETSIRQFYSVMNKSPDRIDQKNGIEYWNVHLHRDGRMSYTFSLHNSTEENVAKLFEQMIGMMSLPADSPVTHMTSLELNSFSSYLEKEFGHSFRLPYEAEWEFACRAGSYASFSSGEALLAEYAEFSSQRPPVWLNGLNLCGQKKGNAWGLFDMHGNAWEICMDGLRGYDSAPVTDPKGALTKSNQVKRGGSKFTQAHECRSAYRSVYKGPDLETGFRLLLEVDQSPPRSGSAQVPENR
ncbi:MAG: formylglycine-generating enzyme family protein [Planctomycetota bacterium]|nr:formylglycine-generating enzyme family protein [Planctomycetota bacterium]